MQTCTNSKDGIPSTILQQVMSSAKRLLKRLLHKRVQCQYGIVLFVSAARILVVEKPICEDEWLKKHNSRDWFQSQQWKAASAVLDACKWVQQR